MGSLPLPAAVFLPLVSLPGQSCRLPHSVRMIWSGYVGSVVFRPRFQRVVAPALAAVATCLLLPAALAAPPKLPATPAPAPNISFNNDIVPVLTRLGCAMGACHGSQFGKGGYKLSLAGFDPDLDYQNTVKAASGRRLSLTDPAHSLLLMKPTMAVPHGGGLRLIPGSADYKLLSRWIQMGAPGPNPADPTISSIEVTPSERILPRTGAALDLKVMATYSDGHKRDVTAHTRLSSLNDAIAACTPEGHVTAAGQGQTAIMVRYGGLATVSTIIVPFKKSSAPVPEGKFTYPADTISAKLDAMVARKQLQLNLPASPVCDDATFARRLFLDILGTAPTRTELEAFIADKSPDKRSKLTDALLERPEYADYWTLKWGDLLRSNRPALGSKGMWSFTNWIHEQMRSNRPVNEMVKELILAQGSTFTNGPSNYYRVASNPQDLAETTSQVFLGVRMQCARCHHHPFEKWSQGDYYQFAAFFARVGLKGSTDFGIFGNENVVKVQDGGEVYHPKTGALMRPAALGVQPALLKEGTKLPDPDADGDRRKALADWLTAPDNHLFARNIANRYWGYLFGKGIVNPIDDQRITNPPSNPQLLDALAEDVVKSGYNLKHLIKTICATRAYQRSSEALPGNAKDELFFTHYQPKRLPAETLLDAIDFACGTREKYQDLPVGTRAIQLPDPAVSSDFLDVFGRPQRLIACECERQTEANLSQTLRLMNGELVNRKAGQAGGRLADLIAKGASDQAILNDLYYAALARPPRLSEKRAVFTVLAFTPQEGRKAVFEDVLVTLLNSKEFLFNH